MRKAQAIQSVVLVLVLLVAIIGMWMIFTGGAGFGLSIGQFTTYRLTLNLDEDYQEVAGIAVELIEVNEEFAEVDIDGETFDVGIGTTSTGIKVRVYKPSCDGACSVRVRLRVPIAPEPDNGIPEGVPLPKAKPAGVAVPECPPGLRKCITEVSGSICSPEGSWKEDFVCPPGTYCSESPETKPCILPVVPECKPGIRKCITDTTVSICGPKGFWQESFVCKEGTYCSEQIVNEPCVARSPPECISGSKKCYSTTSGSVCGTGGYWQETFVCPAGMYCSAKPQTKACVYPSATSQG